MRRWEKFKVVLDIHRRKFTLIVPSDKNIFKDPTRYLSFSSTGSMVLYGGIHYTLSDSGCLGYHGSLSQRGRVVDNAD
jgi:hypothetical protein